MPSMESFNAQDEEYRNAVLPPEVSVRLSVGPLPHGMA